MNKEPSTDLIAGIRIPESWLLDFSELYRGIDNYHTDVRISPRFSADLKRLISELLNAASSSEKHTLDNTRHLQAVQNSYRDMMTALIHRIKTDLDVNAVQALEFAVIKQVLEAVRAQLDAMIDGIKAKASELRAQASTETFTANQRLFQLQKHYDAILFRVNQQIFTQLQRVEMRTLRAFRNKFMPARAYEATDVLFNPMLFTSNLSATSFLAERYRFWGGEGDDAGFNALNSAIETILEDAFPELGSVALNSQNQAASPELYDTLGGLLQTQKFMGIAADQKWQITEDFCWLDAPGNISLLFDIDRHAILLQDARRQSFAEWWKLHKQTRRVKKVLQKIARKLHREKKLGFLFAAAGAKQIWSPRLAEQLDFKSLCLYLSRQISLKKLQERAHGKTEFSEAQSAQFEQTLAQVDKQLHEQRLQGVVQILLDLSRYREHLKNYRFAHRAFNRLQLLNNKEQLALSENAGTLYALLNSQEQQNPDQLIVHHAIMKADIRGSTTVTEELQKRNLNPASFFSLRFFSPINSLLPLYGAHKVFIEGDALILSFLEHEKLPQNWFSVARACGLAKAILHIVQANNRYSSQMGLPHLELGIGISYRNNAPYFLYDEDKPIMISPAIGEADRLSSCSWKLRQTLKPDLFNVDVLQLAEDAQEKGEKGQQYLRYNVNGILLDNAAFTKLETEIALQRVTMTINDASVVFLHGHYPDTEGKNHELLLREERAGLWQGEEIVPGHREGEVFHELIINRQLYSQLKNRAPDKP
ncbi:MAG: hypothetical protein RQ757_07965 [Pseudomonadales bacterium]|nr:hypothetical protein [Pseudomonadales bacterium]